MPEVGEVNMAEGKYVEEKYFAKYRDSVSREFVEQLLEKYTSCHIAFESVESKLTVAEREDLYEMIDKSSFLSPKQKLEAVVGLMMIMAGAFPEPIMVSHLEKVFGKEFVRVIQGKRKELGSGKTGSRESDAKWMMVFPKGVDYSPKTVLIGFSVPGKKMTAMLEPYLGLKTLGRGEFLIKLYKDAPNRALLYVALALSILPLRGIRFGAANREVLKGKWKQDLSAYGGILMDLRDFLKLRFRASGLPDRAYQAVLESLRTGTLPMGMDVKDPDHVIQYTISALYVLSKEVEFSSPGRMSEQVDKLIAMLKAMGELVTDDWEKKWWDDMFSRCQAQL